MPAEITGPFLWISPVSCGEEAACLQAPPTWSTRNAPARHRWAHRLLRPSTPPRCQNERESVTRPHDPHAYEGPRRVFFLYSFLIRSYGSPLAMLRTRDGEVVMNISVMQENLERGLR